MATPAPRSTIRYLRTYAADEADPGRSGRPVRHPAAGADADRVGSVGVEHYAAGLGTDRDTFVAGMQPVLTPELVGKAVLEVAGNPDSWQRSTN